MISDGAAGLIGAAERTLGAALRQRCLIHRARNVLAKVPKDAQARGEGRLLGDLRHARRRSSRASTRSDTFRTVSTRSPQRWRDSYPAAVSCLLADRDSLTVYLRFPREHWTADPALQLHMG